MGTLTASIRADVESAVCDSMWLEGVGGGQRKGEGVRGDVNITSMCPSRPPPEANEGLEQLLLKLFNYVAVGKG